MRPNRWLAGTICIAIELACTIPFSASAANWQTYRNARYGTTVEYPDVFKAEPPPANGDGRTFRSADGSEFSVFASINSQNFTVAAFKRFIVKNLDPADVITYQAHNSRGFVISGTSGPNIFYERHLISRDGQLTEGLIISYPARLKTTYDAIVTRMSRSFQASN